MCVNTIGFDFQTTIQLLMVKLDQETIIDEKISYFYPWSQLILLKDITKRYEMT